jgi:phosphoribosylanthranilate isomerase
MRVKICGIRTRAEAAAAATAGAAYIGFVFYPASPRAVTVGDARWIAEGLTGDTAAAGLIKVALTVDADDETLDRIVGTVPLDLLQLHGHETPERVAEVRGRYRLPVMKAVGISEPDDLDGLRGYEATADQLLIDARPPRSAALPGGNGLAFDWRLIEGRAWRTPWMLAGGLNPQNVEEAVRLTGAVQVDVSSGVERRPGLKDPDLVTAFVHSARDAEAAKIGARG